MMEYLQSLAFQQAITNGVEFVLSGAFLVLLRVGFVILKAKAANTQYASLVDQLEKAATTSALTTQQTYLDKVAPNSESLSPDQKAKAAALALDTMKAILPNKTIADVQKQVVGKDPAASIDQVLGTFIEAAVKKKNDAAMSTLSTPITLNITETATEQPPQGAVTP